ncbi:SDR family NAD(P)-dependent oxidoreductase [Glaciecola siphonariae]|uniref:SDR family NAD(P)-dependent oxidoreductase n=1 Tax=Glaciecola siphonariae TaxID=521012 RepID=A0ABV9M012_9ALTE
MKKILITGATSGIGEALALHAAGQGHEVIACGRNEDKLAELASKNNITTCKFDATSVDDTNDALDNIAFDIAVINAGTCEYVDIKNVEPDMFRRVFEINVFGSVNVASALLKRAKRGNKIVFVDSLARLLPFTRSQAYGGSKAALHYIAKSFEVDLASRGIDVQTISPGFVKTPLTDKNDFKMPMAISAEQAAEYMLSGLLGNRSSVYFPKRFSLFIRFLNFLPEFVQRKICISMRGKAKRQSKND